jgi:hypothetical protein
LAHVHWVVPNMQRLLAAPPPTDVQVSSVIGAVAGHMIVVAQVQVRFAANPPPHVQRSLLAG